MLIKAFSKKRTQIKYFSREKIFGARFCQFNMQVVFLFLVKLFNEVCLLINPKKYHILALYQ
ncbi:MAG: hypothetical protein CFE22_07615 [Cytophagaceae bacterium BCCC1]|nr:MAG: hypothetical protein CFE22_07615 [Cytophagaceae bacterium BCCC1]